MLNRIKYLQFYIFIKISFINEIKYRFLLIITFNFRYFTQNRKSLFDFLVNKINEAIKI